MDGLGYSFVNGVLSDTECEPTCTKMEKIFEGDKEKIIKQLDHILNVQGVEVQRKFVEQPQC